MLSCGLKRKNSENKPKQQTTRNKQQIHRYDFEGLMQYSYTEGVVDGS